ncbi:MAG: DUF4365 domain-containing protein, partial [bacterium]|nr:DUF4365 domain-containing protein [bacterium]
MEKSKQQQTGETAENIFRNAILPEWVTRSQEKDYGIDFEVEVFENNKSTGYLFKVQLKGTENVNTGIKNTHNSFSMEIKHLEYYLEKLMFPVFLVLCDVKTKAVYWLDMQANKTLNAAYEKVKGKQKSLTLQIPKGNRLPGTEKELLAAYEAMMVKLAG